MESSYLRLAMALSLSGAILIPVFGLLLRFQPKFVHGLHVRSSSAEINCYIAGGLYGVLFLVCGLLLALETRGCFGRKEEVATDDVTRRNRRYGLPFMELESKEFARAIKSMDRRTAVTSTPQKKLELPSKFSDKADTV